MAYDIIIEGHTLPGRDRETVTRALAQLVGKAEATAAQLLGGSEHCVKRGVDQATAQQYVSVLRGIGVASRAQAARPELNFDDPVPLTPPAPSSVVTPRNAASVRASDSAPRRTVTSRPPPAAKKKIGLVWKVLGGLFALGILGNLINGVTGVREPTRAVAPANTPAATPVKRAVTPPDIREFGTVFAGGQPVTVSGTSDGKGGRALVFSPPVPVDNDTPQFMREVIQRVFDARVGTRVLEKPPGLVLVGDGQDYWFIPALAKGGDGSWIGALVRPL